MLYVIEGSLGVLLSAGCPDLGIGRLADAENQDFFSLSELGLGWSRDFENAFSLIQMRTTHSSRLVYVSYEVLCGIYLTNS